MTAMCNSASCTLCTILLLVNYCSGLHLKGSWKSSEFFLFLSKFGFQQTNMDDKTNTQGYIYGNITSAENVTNGLTFVVVDSEYFLQYYGNRSTMPRSKACPAMFKKIEQIAWDSECNPPPAGREDFLRSIPCPKGKLCKDEDSPKWVIEGYQFTYRVQDTTQPRFWYISLTSCFRYGNTSGPESCKWSHNPGQDIILDYDIWLVNGHPQMKHINPFEHQFSFDHHDTLEMYLIFFAAYLFLVPIQIYALARQKHMLPFLLTLCMAMEYVGIVFNLIHVFKFAFDGEGVDLLKVVGNFIDNVSQCIFMLLLLLIVKGWTITRMEIGTRSRIVLFTLWGTYTVGNMALFIWNLMEIDNISDIGEWQTWPGWLILVFRIAIMIWFLFELRETVMLERNKEKTRFYLHFGAGYLVWFVYLPIIAVICTQISSLWRYKTLISVTYSADFISYCVLVHLFWPSRSGLYFNLHTETRIQLDDLEYTGTPSDSDSSLDIRDTAAMLAKTKGKTSKVLKNGLAYVAVPKCDIDASPMASS